MSYGPCCKDLFFAPFHPFRVSLKEVQDLDHHISNGRSSREMSAVVTHVPLLHDLLEQKTVIRVF